MKFEDIERRFMTEAAAHGNQISFIIAGITLGLLPHEEVKRGQAILVDAVSHFRQYHGDFARTVVAGDPPKDVADRNRANQIGREAAFEIVKPGVKYSEIRAIGFDAMKKAGMPEEAIIVNPHSVGLQHTDQPYRDDVPYPVAPDIELAPGMTITIDLPYIEVGWGAGHPLRWLFPTKISFSSPKPAMRFSIPRKSRWSWCSFRLAHKKRGARPCAPTLLFRAKRA